MTDDDTGVARLTPGSLDEYFAAGVSTTHVLAQDPRCELIVDPGAQRYELLTPAVGAEPEIVGMKRVSVDSVAMEDGTWFRLRIDCRDVRHEAYGVVVAIVQAMRVGSSFAAATGAALSNLRAILAPRRRLTPDQEIGLLGELLVVRRMLEANDEGATIDSWLGPLAEQHDLAFTDHDVEVKTTTSERRVHVIHGTGQLQPNPGRALWLLSIQVTRAGGADGVSLAALVSEVRGRLSAHRERFLEYLVELGWRNDDADLYQQRFLLRSKPLAYPVDEDFPAITDERVAEVVPHPQLVSEVSYRVDVTSREPGSPGGPLDDFLSSWDGDDV